MKKLFLLFLLCGFVLISTNCSNEPTDSAFARALKNHREDGKEFQYYGKGLFSLKAKKYRKALRYFKKAAKLGNDSSLEKLGYMYINGLGVDKDPIKPLNIMNRFLMKD